MEESILSLFFTRKELNIINDKHIYHLIETYEITSSIAFSTSTYKLLYELLSVNIEHDKIRMKFLCFQTYRMTQVSFSQTCLTINKQRIEGCLTRFFRHCKTSGTSESIAVEILP